MTPGRKDVHALADVVGKTLPVTCSKCSGRRLGVAQIQEGAYRFELIFEGNKSARDMHMVERDTAGLPRTGPALQWDQGKVSRPWSTDTPASKQMGPLPREGINKRRIKCHRRCGAEYVYDLDKLVVPFAAAVRAKVSSFELGGRSGDYVSVPQPKRVRTPSRDW